MSGRLLAIGRKPKPFAEVETLRQVAVALQGGVAGDYRGRMQERAVSVLFQTDWQAASAQISGRELPWTIRRANLFVSGVDNPRRAGVRLQVGEVVLETTDECAPCGRMDRQAPGLTAALMPEWRGGVVCKVLTPGTIRTGDRVILLDAAVALTERHAAALPLGMQG